MSSLRYIFSNSASGRPYARKELPAFRTKDNACVVFDGLDVVFASEAERWTKLRHEWRRPTSALKAFNEIMLEEGKTVPEEIVCDMNNHYHHENHIYECFYQSGFKEAAVFVNDGQGETECVTFAYVQEGKEPLILKNFPLCDSLCGIYHKAAHLIHDYQYAEGKLMGLSAYGKDNGKRYIGFDEQTKSIVANKNAVIEDIEAAFCEDSSKHKNVMLAKDIAYTVQKNFEDVVVALIKHLHECLEEKGIETDNLCMSGGGILNCPANSKVVDLKLFKNYYASPQPSDGCAESIGRAFKQMFTEGEQLESKKCKSAYLGIDYPIEDFVGRNQWLSNFNSELCDFLKGGKVIAWFQGGAEYGPRALGHRSFLADPTSSEMLDSLNKIKGREPWRPLAPVVPEELFDRIFEVENIDMCEFMLRTLTIKEKWRPRLQAVCHVDGTTRPQLLKKDVNPQLHSLLMRWFDETHCPCLVNTSLNINGFPMVETPEDFRSLQEELTFVKDVPEVVGCFVDGNNVYRIPLSDKLLKP